MKLTVERTVSAREVEPGESIVDVDGNELVVDEVSHKADGFKLYVKRPMKGKPGEKVADKESPRKTLEYKANELVNVRPSREESSLILGQIGVFLAAETVPKDLEVAASETLVMFSVVTPGDRSWKVTIEA